MVEKFKTALILLLVLAFASCFEMSGSTSTTDTGTESGVEVSTGLTSSATDAAPEAGETDLNDSSGVGTVVYLPSKPKELSTMTLLLGDVDSGSTSADEDDATVGATATESTAVTEEDAASEDESDLPFDPTYSDSCGAVSGYPGTQFCAVTPETYSLSVKGVYLVTCVDDAGTTVTCSRENQDVSERQALYEGELVTLSVTEEGVSFPQELQEIASDMTASGIQFLMSGFAQQFPSTDPDEAALIASHLRGKAYSRCTTLNQENTADQMESYCGVSDAEFGDILFDVDGDGAYGYVDPALLSPTEVFETAVRPASYDSGALAETLSSLVGMRKFFLDGADAHDGFFAPIFAFSETQEVSSGGAYDFKLTFDLAKTMGFVDGARAIITKERRVCVAGVTGECPYDDDDPESVGAYNPFYDAILFSKPPEVSVSVEEKAEE